MIDLARARSVVFQAGAATVRMTDKTLVVPRLDVDPVASWKAENAAGTGSDPEFSGMTLTAKTLMAYTKISVELLEDAGPEFETFIEQTFAKTMAAAVDRPMPGSVASCSALAGKRPPCSAITAWAQRCRLRARL